MTKFEFERDYWISTDGKQAIWYDSSFSTWIIGSNLGSNNTGGLSSIYDTACPSDDGNKWKFWKDRNWVDAGNDTQVACDGK